MDTRECALTVNVPTVGRCSQSCGLRCGTPVSFQRKRSPYTFLEARSAAIRGGETRHILRLLAAPMTGNGGLPRYQSQRRNNTMEKADIGPGFVIMTWRQ